MSACAEGFLLHKSPFGFATSTAGTKSQYAKYSAATNPASATTAQATTTSHFGSNFAAT